MSAKLIFYFKISKGDCLKPLKGLSRKNKTIKNRCKIKHPVF